MKIIMTDQLRNRLAEILARDGTPEPRKYIEVLDRINSVLDSEAGEIRPRDSQGHAGGLIQLRHDIPTVIVPDIHARMKFVSSVLLYRAGPQTVLERMASNTVQVVCVGDGVHAEKRAAKRWVESHKEFKSDYESHESMDREMAESLGTMEMIMEIKCAFPENFHFLKGNHENISNEEGGGNHPFLKFSDEGAMVARYIDKFYGQDFMNKYYIFEKNLPVFAAGGNFLVSHAEPEMVFGREDIIEYRRNPEVVEGLTWTGNDDAFPGSVDRMIETYIDKDRRSGACYFGGHRPIPGNYSLRADGKYVQFHNPDRFIIAWIEPGSDIDPERDIFEIDDLSGEINI